MALDLTNEQKAIGARNFNQATADLANQPDRRTFMKSAIAAGGIIPVSAAVYFGYDQWKGNKAVRTAFIGVNDEGGVLVGEHNPEYNQIVAVCDIRPYARKRIFEGDGGASPRKGLNKIYGKEASSKIRVFNTVDELLAAKSELGLEMVVIATPLVTHKDIAIKCMDAGLHVLCEKLMARTIGECKAMIAAAKKNGVLLNVGHQRHYSILYAHASELVNDGILGDIKHIRALWHRNNSWTFDAEAAKKTTGLKQIAPGFDLPALHDGWYPPIYKVDADELSPDKVKAYGYRDLPELVRWRCFDRTGGGLMAELGSHQMDAASIFLGKVKPLSVQGVGGKFFYGPGKNDRESDDAVFVTYEFPGKNHPKAGNGGTDANDVVVVTYSSINTNEFEDYGECLMGTRGTMIVEKEANVYLFKEKAKGAEKGDGGKDTNIKVTTEDGKKPVMEAASSWGGAGGPAIAKGPTGGWDTEVRGYRQEMEHFAYCLRRWQEMKQPVSYEKTDGKLVHADILPRCTGEVAMADAILALTANMAMESKQRIEFDPKWFDPESPDTPEAKFSKKA